MRQLIARFGSLAAASQRERFLYSSSRLFTREYQCSNQQCDEITIPVPWGSVSGKWWGAARSTPILAVHGYEDNAGSFDELAPLLVSRNTSFLAIDLLGHGLSSHCAQGTAYNFMDGVLLLRYLVKYFKWDKVTILGHSYGGKVAFTYAAFFPTNVETLIGIDCARAEITQREDNVVQHLRTTIDSTLYVEQKISQNKPPAYSRDEIIQLMQKGSRGPMSKKACEIILKRGAKETHIKGQYHFSRDPKLKTLPLGRLSEEMLFACSSRISCNVLQLQARPGWGFGSSKAHAKSVELMKKGAKRFEQITVKGSHHVHLDDPDQVAAIVKEFIV